MGKFIEELFGLLALNVIMTENECKLSGIDIPKQAKEMKEYLELVIKKEIIKNDRD